MPVLVEMGYSENTLWYGFKYIKMSFMWIVHVVHQIRQLIARRSVVGHKAVHMHTTHCTLISLPPLLCRARHPSRAAADRGT